MHEHTCNKRALPRSRARANYFVPGYASLSRLNPDWIQIANVNTALGCTLYMYMHRHVYIEMQNVYVHVRL